MFINKRIFNVGEMVKIKSSKEIGIIVDKSLSVKKIHILSGKKISCYKYKILIKNIEKEFLESEISKI